MKLESIISQIHPKSNLHAEMARNKIQTLTMPHWALGRLLDLAVDLSAITRTLAPQTSRKTILLFASDHGIVSEGVSLYPSEVTLQMVKNFATGGAAINVLSRQIQAKTVIVDIGVRGDLRDLIAQGQVVNAKIAEGTQNFAHRPAMTPEQAIQAIEAGIQQALRVSSETDIFATGEMGIGNTTASGALASVITGHPVSQMVGTGTGISSEVLKRKTAIIEKAIQFHQPNPTDPVDLLSKLGGFEIGGIAGLILGSAYLQKPIVVDGYISTAAALIAQLLCPTATDYIIPSHCSAETGHDLMWEFLHLDPYLHLGMRLGEGTGAALTLNLVESSARILKEMATFESAGVSRALPTRL